MICIGRGRSTQRTSATVANALLLHRAANLVLDNERATEADAVRCMARQEDVGRSMVGRWISCKSLDGKSTERGGPKSLEMVELIGEQRVLTAVPD